MNNKFTAIYVRRSVSDADKGNNSLSIAAQKEECVKYLGNDSNYKIYCDDGKSGKDIEHRPAFMQMMSDAKDGLISQIIVKKTIVSAVICVNISMSRTGSTSTV